MGRVRIGRSIRLLGYASLRVQGRTDSSDGGCRIADKIAGDMKSDGLTYQQAVDSIGDIVRYTMACTPENLVDNFLKTKTALEGRGYETVKVKNTWETYSEQRPYRGVNCNFKTGDGTTFEIQFHTAESLVGKEVQHGWYEEQRSPRTPESKKAELSARMYENMSGMEAPREVGRIGNYP